MCKDIKMVVFDFDGVFTDGKFYFNKTSITSKNYSAKDAYALKILNKNEIKVGIITNDKIVSIENAQHIFNRLDKYSIGQDRPKLEILDEWIKYYNLDYSNVAYIGDDLADIPVLKKVEFSGCPNDAVEDVKKVCNYICKKKGGDGAVREFVDLIMKNNNSFAVREFVDLIMKNNNSLIESNQIKNDKQITAVIPVRKGSQRCKNKNIRKFGDTNLLKLKIETL